MKLGRLILVIAFFTEGVSAKVNLQPALAAVRGFKRTPVARDLFMYSARGVRLREWALTNVQTRLGRSEDLGDFYNFLAGLRENELRSLQERLAHFETSSRHAQTAEPLFTLHPNPFRGFNGVTPTGEAMFRDFFGFEIVHVDRLRFSATGSAPRRPEVVYPDGLASLLGYVRRIRPHSETLDRVFSAWKETQDGWFAKARLNPEEAKMYQWYIHFGRRGNVTLWFHIWDDELFKDLFPKLIRSSANRAEIIAAAFREEGVRPIDPTISFALSAPKDIPAPGFSEPTAVSVRNLPIFSDETYLFIEMIEHLARAR